MQHVVYELIYFRRKARLESLQDLKNIKKAFSKIISYLALIEAPDL
jgi:hypothetical protein